LPSAGFIVKFATIVGARPQFIKAAPVSRALADTGVEELLIHTGQHYDNNMSDVFFSEMGIPLPAYTLGVGSGTHGMQTGRMLSRIEEVLMVEQPSWVLVYGDTNSTLAGALAAAKLNVPVAHVEAGLRSFNRRMPEELNRVLTDHVSDVLFAPTDEAVRNLASEGIRDGRVLQVGDVMYDAALFFAARADERSGFLKSLDLSPKDYVLSTVHRAENTDSGPRLRAIVEGLARVASQRRVVMPLHPRTRGALDRLRLLDRLGDVQVLDPVGYLDMVVLEKNAAVIATDSGGVQKEAFFFEVPCVTLRDETEWTELVELGWNHLAPPTAASVIHDAIVAAMNGNSGRAALPYGDGNAAVRIAEFFARQ
jgi:UDP-GlcNAc3NAcA epimerase